MADLASLVVRLEAQTAEYERNLERANGRLGRFQSQQSNTLDLITDGFKGLAAGAAVAAAGLGIIYSRQSEVISEFGRLSATLGVATTDLQAFQMASAQLGIEADVVNDVLEEMNIKIGEAALEGGASADALALLGLSAQQLWDMNPADQFELIAERISGLGTQAEKAAASTILLGDAGFKAIQLFESDAISQARKDIEAFGLELTAIDVAAIQNADKAMARLGAVANASQQQFAAAFAPLVEGAALASLTILESFGGMDAIVDDFVNGVVYAASTIADLGQNISGFWTKVRVKILEANLSLVEWRGTAERAAVVAAALADEQEKLNNKLNEPDAGDALLATFVEIRRNAEIAAEKAAQLIANAGNVKPFTGPPAANDDTAEFDRLRERLIAEEQAIEESYLARRELILENTQAGEDERYELLAAIDGERNAALNELTEERRLAELETKREHDEYIVALEQAKWDRLAATSGTGMARMLKHIQTFQNKDAKTWQARTQFALNTFQMLTQGFANESGAMFELNKAASIANAIINTAQGVTLALASAPPPVNFGLAALVAAAGAVQIATIASTSPGGGGGSISSPSGGSGGGAGTAPPVEDLPDVEPERTAQNVNIVIEPGIYDSNSVRDLIGAINEELSDGIDLNVRVG